MLKLEVESAPSQEEKPKIIPRIDATDHPPLPPRRARPPMQVPTERRYLLIRWPPQQGDKQIERNPNSK